MRKWFGIGILVVGLGFASACGGADGTSAEAPKARPATTSGTVAPRSREVTLQLSEPSRQTVPARANIFGAGYKVPPEPGGGGGGVLPPVWRLPAGAARVLVFPTATGRVTPINWQDSWNGPAGDRYGPRGEVIPDQNRAQTNLTSYRGISGIVHRGNGMFVVGVFLTDQPAAPPAPPRLDFSDREDFDVLAPRIGQTFLVGDGQGRTYRVPSRATRLFVGFADGYLYDGAPGYYNNNDGKVVVTARVTTR